MYFKKHAYISMGEFFKLLKEGRWVWSFDAARRIRIKGGTHCPISKVFNLSPSSIDYSMLDYSPLSECTTRILVSAADNSGAPKTREKLLKACGLKEKT